MLLDINDKKILVTRLRFIGDIILTTPLIETLKVNFPDAKIYYLAEKETSKLLIGNPYLAGIIPLDYKITKLDYLKFILNLRRNNFDVVIDLFGNPRSTLLTFLSGAKIKIGGAYKSRNKFYTHIINENQEISNQIERHLLFASYFNVKNKFIKTKVYIDEEEKSQAVNILNNIGIDLSKPVVGLYAGATWQAKKWFPERFASLADKVKQELNSQVLFFKSQEDTELINFIKEKSLYNHFYLNNYDIRTTAALLDFVNVFVSNDCGLLHLAPAVGTKTIGLFGPGEDKMWFPYSIGDGCISLRKHVPCHPCHLDYCDKLDCWKLLKVEEVFEKINYLTYTR
jgi:lipopolysaccharide heptosyltransferase II